MVRQGPRAEIRLQDRARDRLSPQHTCFAIWKVFFAIGFGFGMGNLQITDTNIYQEVEPTYQTISFLNIKRL